MPARETRHVIVKQQKGSRWSKGLYKCKCGAKFTRYHDWRRHRHDEIVARTVAA